MYRFLQKHGKKLMAIFAAFLMISFALPAAYQAGDNSRNPVIGKIDGKKLYANELSEAQRSWEVLKSLGSGGPRGGSIADAVLGPAGVSQIDRHPVLFLLLQKEAQNQGATVNNDLVESIVRNDAGLLSGNEERDAVVRRAVADLLLVRQGFTRATSAIKVTDPMIRHELAELQQSITLSAVEFTPAQYLDKVPAPTAEELKSQFEKYADTSKGAASESNPFGFGYKYPDRVKIQYITAPRADVRKAVEAAKNKDAYAFTVEAQRFYQQNRGLYASTQPATTAPAAPDPFSLGSGGVKPAPATTAPTTRPFVEVEQDVKRRLIDAETDKKAAAITTRVNEQLAADWAAYRAVAGKTPATTPAAAIAGSTQALSASTRPAVNAPPTALGAPYNSFDYLKNLAAMIQKDFGVLPTVVSKADAWMNHDELKALPGIGQATLGGFPFPDYVMGFTAPFVAPSQRDESGVIQVLEPTRPLSDTQSSVYIARVSDADPTHKPATLTEVEAAVRNDILTQQAYELAKADANKLLDQASKDGLNAATGGKRIVNVGPLSQRRDSAIPQLALTGDPALRFIEGAFKLLSTPTSRPSGKPVKLIDLPQDGRLIVAELGNVDAMWNDRTRPFAEAEIQRMINQQLASRFSQSWFDYKTVTSRVNFVPDAILNEEDLASTEQ